MNSSDWLRQTASKIARISGNRPAVTRNQLVRADLARRPQNRARRKGHTKLSLDVLRLRIAPKLSSIMQPGPRPAIVDKNQAVAWPSTGSFGSCKPQRSTAGAIALVTIGGPGSGLAGDLVLQLDSGDVLRQCLVLCRVQAADSAAKRGEVILAYQRSVKRLAAQDRR